MHISKAALAVIMLVSATAAQAGPNLVTNGGFEDGLTGWNAYGWSVAGSYGGVGSYEGANHAYTGCVGNFCTLDQTIATVAGTHYDISFAFNPGNSVQNSAGGRTDVYFGSQLLTSIIGGTNAYTVYNFSDVVASDASTTLLFSGHQDPAWNGVDAVSVVQSSSPAPEPASWAMMLGGFGVVGGALRSRRKAAVRFA